ncbi:MAG: DoxX family membrane protein [Pseudomonadota bacterium]
MNKVISTVLSIFVAFVFVQSLFFKFSGSEETVIIFSTIGQWMSSIGLPAFVANLFGEFGGYGVGTTELVASALILIPATRKLGASIAFVVMSGAIFFHLGTPLGVDRVVDAAGNTDGGALFFTAVGVWVSSAVIIALSRVKKTVSSKDAAADMEPALA